MPEGSFILKGNVCKPADPLAKVSLRPNPSLQDKENNILQDKENNITSFRAFSLQRQQLTPRRLSRKTD